MRIKPDMAEQDDDWNKGRPVSRVFRNIMLISKFYNDAIEQTAKENGLQSGEFLVLMTLLRVGGNTGLRPTELYNQLLVTSGAITKRVDRLADMGLIERVTSKKDKRSSSIRLTAKGIEKGEAIRNQRNKLHVVAELLSSSELNELDKILQTYLAAIEQTDKQEQQ